MVFLCVTEMDGRCAVLYTIDAHGILLMINKTTFDAFVYVEKKGNLYFGSSKQVKLNAHNSVQSIN